MLKNIYDIKNIFYINLDSRPDRKNRFENEMNKLQLTSKRFKAIKHSVGAIGCSMSHLALLKYAKQNNLDHILIMEDDISFLSPDIFINSLNKFLTSNIDFDVLLIAGNNMGEYTRINDYCVKITKCQTTTGYLIKNKYYDKLITNIQTGINLLLRNLNKLNRFAIDQYWTNLQLTDKWYLLTPLTVTQHPDYSDIEKRNINYNRVMLDLDKKQLRSVGIIKEHPHPTNTLSSTLTSVIHNS